MLREWIAAEMPEEEELKNRLEAAREKMAVQQLQMKEKKVPVLVLVEGWGTSGKGSSIGRIIQILTLVSSRYLTWRRRRRRMQENRSCTAILQRFQRRESLYFLIPAG